MAMSLMSRCCQGKMLASLVLSNTARLNTLARASPLTRMVTAQKPISLINTLTKQGHILRSLKTSAPKSASAGSNYACLWSGERLLSLGLLGVVPLAFIFPCQALDTLLSVSIIVHSYLGLEAVVVDYIRPVVFGNVVPKVAHAMLVVLCAATLAGLLYFTYNDVGIAKAIRKFWAIKPAAE